MIRNVVVGKLRDRSGAEQLQRGLDGIAQLSLPGNLSMHVGLDTGLRDGGWTFAITNDWADADAYRVYDLDEQHNVYRAMIVEVCSDIARVQFEIQAR